MMLDSDFAVKQEQHNDRLARAAQARLVKPAIERDDKTSLWQSAKRWLTQTKRPEGSPQRPCLVDESA